MAQDRPLEDRSVLVTGGGRGIGRAIALGFGARGARVVVAARTRVQVEAVAAEIRRAGGRSLAVAMDVADPASVRAGTARALEELDGVLDVLVNNAGVFAIRPFPEMDLETWRRHVAVNLDGPFLVALEALPALQASSAAHVFNVSSVAGLRAYPGNTAYSATKFGLRGFSDALRLDLAELGIRVSTVYPGATDTSIFDDVPGEWDRSAMNRPEDVADVVLHAYAHAGDDYGTDLEVPPPGQAD